jgi:MYXO-CTERM domain-containing protein
MIRSGWTARRSLGRLVPRSTLLVVLASLVLGACSGEGCDCNGFQQQEFPSEHNDVTVPRSGQVRLTDTGMTFLEQQVPNILREALPNGLNFCIPKTSPERADVCHVSQCDSGQTGCQLNLSIEDVSIRTASQEDELLVDVTVGMLNEKIPFDYDLIFGATANCQADLHKDNAGNDVPGTIDATIPLRFPVDQQSPTRDVSLEIGQIATDLNDLGIDIDGRGGFGNTAACETADTVVKPFARGQIEDQLVSELNAAVRNAVREERCRACGDDQPACPMASSCQDFNDGEAQYCAWDADDRDGCVRKPLGVEGRLVLDSLLGDFMEPEAANVDLMAKAADTADVADGGLNLGMRAGFQYDKLRDCAPATPDTRPSLSPIPPSSKIFTNAQPGSGDSFMIGLGLHKNAVEQMAWSTWASGATCLKVGTSFSDMLTTESLSLFLSSLEKLTNRSAPVFLRVAPQTAPSVELGPNTITETEDGYQLDDPLLTIDWSDLDLHFYAFVQDRYVRLYTTRLDVELPVGLTTDGMGSLVPVVGDLEAAVKNIRVRNRGILAEDEETLRGIVPQLLSAALPRITGSLSDPIELPTFFGYRVAVDQEDITSVDNNQFIALYANLKYVGNAGQSLVARLEPDIRETNVDVSPTGRGDIRRPEVELIVGARRVRGGPVAADQLEYSYRVDNGFWSMYSKKPTMTLDAPVLALPGEHRIQVRARVPGTPGTASRPVETRVTIDYQPPELRLERDENAKHIVLEGDDIVDPDEALQYRYRIEESGGELTSWSAWSDDNTLELEALDVDGDSFRVMAQVRDTSGYVGESTETFEAPVNGEGRTGVDGESDTANSGAPQPGGCGVAGGSAPGSSGGLLVGLLAIVGVFFRRRSRSAWLSAILLALLVASSGCNEDVGSRNSTPDAGDSGQCTPACQPWETCENETCVPEGCESGDACGGEATCVDGSCREAQCQTDSDCDCESDQEGICMNGMCRCQDFCADGCGDGQYCCYAEDSCKPIPDPCQGKSCDPGYKPEVQSRGTPDNKECTIDGAACECVEKDPIELRWYGQYASSDANDEVTAVSAYNRFYGDLMVGTLGDELEPTWYTPDGVPEDGEIVAAPSGPRGGTDERGDDVGTHTAIAVDDSGSLHVFYRSEESDALKYARGRDEGDGYSFATTEIDAEQDTGYYTSTLVREGVVHAVYGVPEAPVEIDGEQMTGSQIRHVSFPTDTPVDQLAVEPETLHAAPPPSPCNTCADGQKCVEASAECRETTSDCEGCEDGQACFDGECRGIYQRPELPAHRLMTGLYNRLAPTDDGLFILFYDHINRRIGWTTGTTGDWQQPTYLEGETGPYADVAFDSNGDRHIVYMDPGAQSLKYRGPDADGDEVVDDGVRNGSDEYLQAQIGQNVRLWIDDSGTPRVVYQDATTHELHRAERTGADSWSTTALRGPGSIENYEGARGFFTATPAPSTDIVVEHVIDQQAEPAEAHLDFTSMQ